MLHIFEKTKFVDSTSNLGTLHSSNYKSAFTKLVDLMVSAWVTMFAGDNSNFTVSSPYAYTPFSQNAMAALENLEYLQDVSAPSRIPTLRFFDVSGKPINVKVAALPVRTTANIDITGGYPTADVAHLVFALNEIFNRMIQTTNRAIGYGGYGGKDIFNNDTLELNFWSKAKSIDLGEAKLNKFTDTAVSAHILWEKYTDVLYETSIGKMITDLISNASDVFARYAIDIKTMLTNVNVKLYQTSAYVLDLNTGITIASADVVEPLLNKGTQNRTFTSDGNSLTALDFLGLARMGEKQMNRNTIAFVQKFIEPFNRGMLQVLSYYTVETAAGLAGLTETSIYSQTHAISVVDSARIALNTDIAPLDPSSIY